MRGERRCLTGETLGGGKVFLDQRLGGKIETGESHEVPTPTPVLPTEKTKVGRTIGEKLDGPLQGPVGTGSSSAGTSLRNKKHDRIVRMKECKTFIRSKEVSGVYSFSYRIVN